MSIHNIEEETRSALTAKIERLLSQVDATLVTGQQKLRLFRDAVYPWAISHGTCPSLISPPPGSKINLDIMVMRFLKHWTGLARSVCTSPNPLVACSFLRLPPCTRSYIVQRQPL